MSGLQNISPQEIHSRLHKLVRSERKLTHIILQYILEMEERRIYLDHGFSSAFDYLTKSLGYSESAAYRRLKSARLLKRVPEISEKLEQGKLNLSQLTEVQKSIEAVNKNVRSYHNSNSTLDDAKLSAHETNSSDYDNLPAWNISADSTRSLLDKLENKNSFETKQIIAQSLNIPVEKQSKINPQKDESVTVTLNFSKEEYEMLKQAQSLISHACPHNSLTEVITYLAKNVVKKSTTFGRMSKSVDSVPTAKMNQLKHVSQEQNQIPSRRPRKYISKLTKLTLLQRSQNHCEYVHPRTQQRCHSNYQLQIDHIYPHALGGSDAITNLRILCGAHNRG